MHLIITGDCEWTQQGYDYSIGQMKKTDEI